MANRYGIWLSYNNQEEGFELPVLPAEMEVNGKGAGAGYEVYGLGKINVIKAADLTEYKIESIFPAQVYPFITGNMVFEPRVYVNFIEKWRATKRPIRFVFTGSTMDINMAVSIESFDWKEAAGASGDIHFSLGLKEYRFYAARRVQVVEQGDGSASIQQQEAGRANERLIPLAYTVAEGDTLWKISRKLYGTSSLQQQIQQLNNLTHAQVRPLQPGTVLKMPQVNAYD